MSDPRVIDAVNRLEHLTTQGPTQSISTVSLLTNLAEVYAALRNDPQAVLALSDEVRIRAERLYAATVAQPGQANVQGANVDREMTNAMGFPVARTRAPAPLVQSGVTIIEPLPPDPPRVIGGMLPPGVGGPPLAPPDAPRIDMGG